MTPSYDLLPSEFKNKQRFRRIVFAWGAFSFLLAASLVGVYASMQLRSIKEERARQQLAASAVPLLDLKRQSKQIDQEIISRRKWTAWVESAKPNDDALQTTAAIISSIEEDEIRINHLHVKLPIEFSLTEKKTPDWAVPHILVHAQASGQQRLRQWISQLNLSDRIGNAQLAAESFDGGIPNAEIKAVPLVTGVVP